LAKQAFLFKKLDTHKLKKYLFRKFGKQTTDAQINVTETYTLKVPI